MPRRNSGSTTALQVAGVWCTGPAGAPALQRRFTLQSCLCPTPDLRSFHMGIASTTFSSLCADVRAFGHWLCSTWNAPVQAESSAPESSNVPGGSHLDDRAVPVRVPSTWPRSQGRSGQRPLRGNWPFTVDPGTLPPEGKAPTSSAMGPAQAPLSPYSRYSSTLRTVAGAGHGAAKVLRKADVAGGTGRLVIAGRMADVCAELDRMAASEAALSAC